MKFNFNRDLIDISYTGWVIINLEIINFEYKYNKYMTDNNEICLLIRWN